MPIESADILNDPNLSGLLPLIGAVAVYVFREVYKDFKYNKIRANEREEREANQQRTCQFDDSQRERIFNLTNGTRNRDELLKEISRDQENILKSMDRMIDKIDSICDDLAARKRRE